MQIAELILEVRRLARQKRPSEVSFVHLGASPYIKASTARYHYFRNTIGEIGQETGAAIDELERGTLCLVNIGTTGVTAPRLRDLLVAEVDGGSSEHALDSVLETYVLPDAYVALRERLEAFTRHPEPDPEEPAEDDDRPGLAGPLTAELLARIEARLDGVDLAGFVRRQSVYRRAADGWVQIYREQYTSLADLGAALFPRVEIDPDTPLFAELTRHLDRLMLVAVLLNRPWRQQRLGLNLGHAAWSTDEYRRLLRNLDDHERGRLTFEVHWLDVLRDLSSGGRALAEMRAAGCRIAVDRLHIETLPLLDLARIEADHLKLVYDKARLPLLLETDYLGALRRAGVDRIVLTNCDDRQALVLGARLGISHYQGWLVDRVTRTATHAPQRPTA